MGKSEFATGESELKRARRDSQPLYWSVAIFSSFINLLMLTGPLFMLQIYDRVLGSRSEETLVALFALVAFLYAMMGILDNVRSRILLRIATNFQASLDRRVFRAVVSAETLSPGAALSASGMQDLGAIRRFISSPVLAAFFDIPWTPIFLLGIFIFHPWLGSLALGGGFVLVLVTVSNQLLTRQSVADANIAARKADIFSEHIRNEAEMVNALGMSDAAFDRWQLTRSIAHHKGVSAGEVGGTFLSISKALRLFLQSAMLALGAYLVLQEQLTGGAMIASSILLGRALAPVELAISQWTVFQQAQRGWQNLSRLLTAVRPASVPMGLPVPKAILDVDQLTVFPPGEKQAALRVVSFSVRPGQSIGVIGPSGAGKSTLARSLSGVWQPTGGSIRLDGAKLEQYDNAAIGNYIGYLPQRVELFDGTIADNIARLQIDFDPKDVVKAARKADAHDMILKLPNGYDTPVLSASSHLSGGQIQRLGLARALFGDPVIVVLDEPNSNLDNNGSEALNLAIRDLKASGKAILIMAHRPAAIKECDTILVLENGTLRAFGPKDEVLKGLVRNHEEIQKSTDAGGVI